MEPDWAPIKSVEVFELTSDDIERLKAFRDHAKKRADKIPIQRDGIHTRTREQLEKINREINRFLLRHNF